MFNELEEMREMRREMKEQKEGISEEIRKMKEGMWEREESWRRDREELRREIEEVRREMEGLKEQVGRGWEEEERRRGGRETTKRDGRLETEIRDLVRWRELEERERRRRNVVVKGLEAKREGIEGQIGRIWKELGVEAKIEEIREIGGRNGKEKKMTVVRMEDRKGKMEIMRKKVALRGKVVRIEDD